ncbi:2-oxo acid dehydrogenase subunit E2 [Marinobacter sp. TBZ242]|uniref:2-oxo acid dehydrogenase subunit E2 n=1 Tax=Marinobacter azerbaijanicus TaxID=3050455 RepID=A0ABT7IBN8_9GAMM|nr:2-oxo acid dehydrogenase subunit E2 [Marinobacter sp. TBZ242]MDL0431572.1 2-oxo acid dehydrogenase subunit E2 [Marinobacter sp. TBZ242]
MIANNMRRSLDEAAQLTHQAECELDALLTYKKTLAERGTKVSIEDLLADCVVRTLARHPGLNGRLEDKEIHLYRKVHLGFAIALPGDKLIAPVVFDANEKTLTERADSRRKLLERARAGNLSVPEMTGGTFTLSNLGRSRVRFFTPIINLPQLAILGIGEAYTRPVEDSDGQWVVRRFMGLSLTFDHRAVDGGPAAEFLTDLCGVIEHVGD